MEDWDILTVVTLGHMGWFMQLTIDWYVNDEMKGIFW